MHLLSIGIDLWHVGIKAKLNLPPHVQCELQVYMLMYVVIHINLMRLILEILLAAQPGKGEVVAHGLHIFGRDPTQVLRTHSGMRP